MNATAVRLGLTGTVVRSDLMAVLDSIGEDLGHADRQDLIAWSAGASAQESARADALLPGARALTPGRGTTTTRGTWSPCSG